MLITGTALRDEAANTQGVLLFLEDVTHLLRVERMEAWREVARRIAHEIKNPLTPIQLAAQRLRRRFGNQLRQDGAVFDECTRTIIQQVESLKTLVNEFSTFARLPQAEHRPHDLNRVVEEVLVLFRQAHREIDFSFEEESDLPLLELDREGMKRAVINILDNAVAACAARPATQADERRRVEVRTRWDRAPRCDPARDRRRRRGHDAGDARARLRALLLDEARGHWTRPGDRLGDRRGPQGLHPRAREPTGGTRFVLEFPVRSRPAHLVARARLGAYGS